MTAKPVLALIVPKAHGTVFFFTKNPCKKAQSWAIHDGSSNARSKSAGSGEVLSTILNICQEQQHCVGLEDTEYIPDVHTA